MIGWVWIFSMLNITCRSSLTNNSDSAFSIWNTSTVLLLRGDNQMAVGYINNSIFLIGGALYDFQVTEYNITSNEMIDHGTGAISSAMYGLGQYYTQIGNIVFMIDPEYNGVSFSTYNLFTNDFEYYWNSVNIPIAVRGGGCLAGNMDYLFVSGGADGNNWGIELLQILNLATLDWISGPNMNHRRRAHSCNIHTNTKTLYVLGGIDNNGGAITPTVEKIFIENFTQQSWQELHQRILPTSMHRSVVFGNYIFIIGGYQNPQFRYRIQSVNCMNDDITHEVAFLDYGMRETSAIIVGNIIYAFGGYTPSRLNTWQYSILAPTMMPTPTPTNIPSLPSIAPTQLPSTSPTAQPPTGCVKFNSSVDMRNENIITIEKWENHYYETPTSSRVIYKGDTRNKYYLQTTTCINDTYDAGECYIECIADESCVQLNIVPVKSLSKLSIICNSTKACKESSLIVDNVIISNILIICTSWLACSNMNIKINNIETQPLQSLNIYCVHSYSCYNMQITVTASDIKHIYNDYKIICQS
eukprot:426210_1